MRAILLTGATGFIGQPCVDLLVARGFHVHAVSSKGQIRKQEGVTWHHADLRQPGIAQTLLSEVKPTDMLHLAWYVVPGQLITSPENLSWVTASVDLIREFAANHGKRLVIAGSAYEYDWNYGYCSETLTPANPNTVYGSCKHALQLMAQSIAAQTGISMAWGRVFFLYGPREHPQRLVSSVMRALLKGEPAQCSHGRQIRDYLHVDDVANGLVSLLDSKLEGPVNVCSGEAVTLRDIVLTIGRVLGRPDLIQLGAIPARANDTALVVGDNSRLRAETGWEQGYNLEAGLQQTADWWRMHLNEAKQ